MIHKFIKGNKKDRTLILFHGTGGTEEDLIPLAGMIDPDASILSLRGNVSENGMNRFFRRLSEGIFDEEDIRARAKEIVTFLDETVDEYGIDRKSLVGIGYSNGANIIAAMHYLYGDTFTRSILFHPMVPLKAAEKIDLSSVSIFIGAGENDPIVPIENTMKLEDFLSSNGADVTMKKYNKGHSLTIEEVNDATTWYAQI
ncbi:alpha/beta hydrolase [Proteiniclasticum sp.]|uniref:alpha/beta hydrolase n=1 Tax=Proteiniclasticum sp. TaxID=2053595 RepID=UPI00289B4120|nr:alpha/beta hydrolase [Proteiniclasticum sp.]